MLSLKKSKQKQWKNWSESVVAMPKQYVSPANMEELITIVKRCAENRMTLRVVGAGHSFTPLVATNEMLVSLDHLTGIEKIDAENNVVTVWAGSRLKDLGPLLYGHGYAMENLGDINEQSIAGAISTGTHGTGIQFGSIATQVEGLTIVTASGNLLEISRDTNTDYFEAARVSLGVLGIIVKVQLKVVPAYQLIGNSYRLSLQDCFSRLTELKEANRNFEFFWFPYTETVQVKTCNQVGIAEKVEQKQQSLKKLIVENGLFWALSEMSRLLPVTSKAVSTISAIGVPVGVEQNDSYRLYATPRLVKFHEMEYSIPASAMAEVLKEINLMLQRKKFAVHFPIECRYVKADSIWLSPSYKRDSAYIAVHMYKGMEFGAYFKAVEEIFQAYEGRPHWGKMHSMTYEQLVDIYPKFPEFLQARRQLDEHGLLLNEYLRKMFQV